MNGLYPGKGERVMGKGNGERGKGDIFFHLLFEYGSVRYGTVLIKAGTKAKSRPLEKKTNITKEAGRGQMCDKASRSSLDLEVESK